RARELLMRSFQHALKVNVRATVVHGPRHGHGPETVQVEQTRSGKLRITVVWPESRRGMQTVDDGTKSVTYIPWRQTLVVQESPQRDGKNAKRRIELAARNYDLVAEPASFMLGREVVRITAIPRAEFLPSRRFTLDAETAYVLKQEVLPPGREPDIQFEVTSIEYPTTLDEPTTNIATSGETKIRYTNRSPYVPGHGAEAIGFEPIIPKSSLPLGFVVFSVQINRSERWHSAALRIGDGLVRGTVYEFLPGGDRFPSPPPGPLQGQVN
ncbi:MAG: hypothetical protein HY248_00960, partial [Fimbriimonas ginsengisoli]|nr:hypothetical protein [Fimbriimonas ginsengisoli]